MIQLTPSVAQKSIEKEQSMNIYSKSPGNNHEAEQVLTSMWEKGVKNVAAMLPVDFRDRHSSCFEGSIAGADLLDISSLDPLALPRAEFVTRSSALEGLMGFVFKNTPHSSLNFNPSRPRLTDAGKESARLVELSPDEIMEQLTVTFNVVEVSLLDTVTDDDYIFTKINHRCWEEITHLGLSNSGKEYIRKIGSIDHECIDSGFYECMALCLISKARDLSVNAHTGNTFQLCSSDFSFGIALTGGNASFLDDVKGQGRDVRIINNIYPRVTLGTAAGVTGFFSSLVKDKHSWLVADGSAPKKLFWDGQFGQFMERIAESSDAILFIVPPWLRGVTLADTLGVKVFKLIVPGENIDSMWGLVAPLALQYIGELSSKYRLTVLSQCSVVSAVIGMMASLHFKKTKHRSPCRFYDLGQLLDLANSKGTDTGYWLSRKDVRTHASETDDWSDLIWLTDAAEP